MKVTLSDLQRTYSAKADEELLLLHGRGSLTDSAYEALEAELASRKIPVPPRPPVMMPSSEAMTREEQVQTLKYLGVMVSFVPVIGVAAPLVNVYFRDDLAWASLIIALGPMVLFVRGVRALVYPVESVARLRAVLLGAASAALLLVLAPVSISVAVDNINDRPSWIALSLTGTVTSVVYLWFAYRHWMNRSNA